MAIASPRGRADGPWTPVDERDALPDVPPWLIVAGALVCAAVFGHLLAGGKMKYGIAVVLVICYGPLVFFDLSRALALWVAILFFSDISVLSSGPNGVGVLIGLGWLGAFLGGRGTVFVREHRRLLSVIVLFLLWVTLTITWSQNTADAANEAAYWALAGLAFLVVLTTIKTPEAAGRLALAFLVGSLISVIIGLGTGSLAPSTSNAVTNTAVQGRFSGGGGDPNQQAAAFVAAMFLAIGLFSLYRRKAVRIALTAGFIVVAIGFFATESRGGLVALAVAALAALALAPGQRRRVVGLIVLVAAAGAILVATTPGALTRITNLGGGTSGRSDLWRVGWDVFSGHPLFGIGAGNFVVVEAHYVLRPGAISRIQYLVDVPHLVHNTYLQIAAETGLVGLLGYATVIVGSLWSGYRAARRFDVLGLTRYADLTRAIMMGTIGMLAALFFITDGDDLRLWVLLALGPALFGIAGRMAAEHAAPPGDAEPLQAAAPR